MVTGPPHGRQVSIGGEEAAIDDLMIGFGLAILPEIPDDVDRDVIAWRDMAVEENAVKHRFAGYLDSSLLHQFPLQGHSECLADLDTASGQMPARHITVLDQKHAIVAVKHHAPHAECHAAGEPPIQMEEPAQHGLETAAQTLQIHGLIPD
jgi:hypothetical protein